MYDLVLAQRPLPKGHYEDCNYLDHNWNIWISPNSSCSNLVASTLRCELQTDHLHVQTKNDWASTTLSKLAD